MNDRLEELRGGTTAYHRMEDDDHFRPSTRSQSSGNVHLLEPFFEDMGVVKVTTPMATKAMMMVVVRVVQRGDVDLVLWLCGCC